MASKSHHPPVWLVCVTFAPEALEMSVRHVNRFVTKLAPKTETHTKLPKPERARETEKDREREKEKERVGEREKE